MTDNFLDQGKLICVDWGSSNFRAFLLDDKAELVDRIYFDKGMLELKPDEFEPVLFDLLKYWPTTPIILAGMVGSQKGWRNVKYITCPVKMHDLSQNLTHIVNAQARKVAIIAGVDTEASGAQYDVARGEETQVIGAIEMIGQALEKQAVFCLPGTHSKWMKIADKSIVDFSTHMTGELYDLLIKHSILAPQPASAPKIEDDEAFIKGVKCAKADGGLAHHIFSARTNMLNGELQQNEIEPYLSGILIGTEIKEMQRAIENMQHVYLVGTQALNKLFQLALQQFDLPSSLIDGEKAAYTGMSSIAKQANL
ncbi:MAG: hypothetical protein COB24_06110 [Hyphomicrobiales bacterium]|nr:MAG: hypothetical protein COB24_06110 [Hyphomicrobiales bacterium]